MLTELLSIPKFTENLYCICISMPQILTEADAVQICGKFWDTQYVPVVWRKRWTHYGHFCPIVCQECTNTCSHNTGPAAEEYRLVKGRVAIPVFFGRIRTRFFWKDRIQIRNSEEVRSGSCFSPVWIRLNCSRYRSPGKKAWKSRGAVTACVIIIVAGFFLINVFTGFSP